jgi:hypothetical protein
VTLDNFHPQAPLSRSYPRPWAIVVAAPGPVDRFGRNGEPDVVVPFYQGFPADSPLCVGTLLVDAAQGATG